MSLPPRAVARWLLLAVCAFAMWITPIRSGLALDETGTCWVVSGTFGEAIDRALRFQGQSPLYYLVERLAVAVGGLNEVTLRLPSVIAMALTCLLVERIGRRLWNAEVGFLAAVAFVSTSEICYSACDARPYALGVLSTTAATWALMDWFESGRAWRGLLYAVLAASVVYVHYMFATTVVVHALYILARRRAGMALPTARGLALVVAALAVLFLPLLPQVRSLYGRSHTLEFSAPATWAGFVVWLLPSVSMLMLLGGVVLILMGRLSWLELPRAREGPTALALVVGWHVVPAICLLLVSRVALRVFVTRYQLNGAPGFALLAGWLLAGVPTPRARSIAAALLLVFSTVLLASATHSPEDWGLTARVVRSCVEKDRTPEQAARTPVLLDAGFIESLQPEWLADEHERRSYLLAPLSLYPLPGCVLPLPCKVAPWTRPYLEDRARQLEDCDRFVLVTNWPRDRNPVLWVWFDARLSARGFVSRAAGFTGAMWIVVFERDRTRR